MRSFGVEDLLEDLEEFRFLNFSVSRGVNGFDELGNFILADLPVAVHVLESSVDEGLNFIGIETIAIVGVELFEDGINCISDLLITV